jgi:hypothetical protein
MYKKYHNMLQVVLVASPSSGGMNKTENLKQEIKEFYLYEDLFVGDKLVSYDVNANHNNMQAKKQKAMIVVNKCNNCYVA